VSTQRCRALVIPVALAVVLGAIGCREFGAVAGSDVAADSLLVAAAANTQFAFQEIGDEFETRAGQSVEFSFGSSGSLAAQIANGAPFDVFASADVLRVDALRADGLILPDTQRVYARGQLVLVVNRESGITVETVYDLASTGIARIAIANPTHAPYGLAAQQALERAGLLEDVQSKLVFGETVRQALQFVQSGNAPAGVVARAIADVPEVEWTAVDPNLYDPVEQAMAVLSGTEREQLARQFVDFVTGPEGQGVLQRYGYRSPESSE
jgi:molybdate transport system substrate-binding protein